MNSAINPIRFALEDGHRPRLKLLIYPNPITVRQETPIYIGFSNFLVEFVPCPLPVLESRTKPDKLAMDSVDQDRLLDEAARERRRRWGWNEEQIEEFQRERTKIEKNCARNWLQNCVRGKSWNMKEEIGTRPPGEPCWICIFRQSARHGNKTARCALRNSWKAERS